MYDEEDIVQKNKTVLLPPKKLGNKKEEDNK